MSKQTLPSGALAEAKNPEWVVPKDWQPGKPSTVRRGSWTVSGAEGQVADIAVTVFPGDVGGQLANVNRWRGQIGLAPIQQQEVESITTKLVFGSTTANVVDFTNPTPAATGKQPQRMIVATVPHGGNSWFFKMTGDAPVVEAQKKSFLEFVQSAKF